MPGPVSVTFAPSGATAWARPGDTVLSVARRAGVSILASCAGRGTCGECAVRVLDGELDVVGAVEKRGLGRSSAAGVRLACQAKIVGPVVIRPVIALGKHVEQMEAAGDERLIAAVDVGTTNVHAVVIGATSGRQVGTSTVANRQSSWGADVLSRLSAAAVDAVALREAAENSIEEALSAAALGALGRIERLVIAGNTAMIALLTQADVSPLATHPFAIPDGMRSLGVDSALRAWLGPEARIDLVPPLASFVGGDLLAGLIATDMTPRRKPELLVDVGTNAEVALAAHGRIFVASAAAGPAFEGSGLSCGGPAVEGAVTRVRVDSSSNVDFDTVGGAPARWFSGAGLISALATLRVLGHLDASGLLREAGPLRARFSRDEAGVLLLDLGGEDACLRVTQLDVRALQLAKAAVRTAIQMVLEHAGVRARSLSVVRIAGAFGAALESDDLVQLGLVPRQAGSSVVWVGNTSLSGAVALALDEELWGGLSSLTENVTHVSLASDDRFSEKMIAALALEAYSA